MTGSPYKGYEEQANGANSGTWGTVLNDDVFTPMDSNLGGWEEVALLASNVVLTADQASLCLIRLTGTLSASVQVTSSNEGFYFVENLCVLGAFAVTWTNGAGSALTLATNRRYLIYADSGDGARIVGEASTTNPEIAPTGTEMLFVQTAVPTGWTLKATWDDYALRLSDSAGGTTTGSVAYSTLFATTTAGAHTLTIAETPAHQHTYEANCSGDNGPAILVAWWCSFDSSGDAQTAYTTFAGGGNSHSHGLDIRVQTVTAIVGVRQ